MSSPTRFSYGLLIATLLLANWLHLAVPLLAVLFSLFILNKLHFTRYKWLTVLVFVIVLAGILYTAGHFTKAAVVALPKIAENSIPSILAWAQAHNIELPFTDYESLKTEAMDTVKEQAHYVGNFATFARGASTTLIFLIVGIVVAVSLFLNAQLDLDRDSHRIKNNLYSVCSDAVAARFRTFYESFATVMGAQLLISAINTVLTSIFIFGVRLPYAPVMVGLTFICGLVPLVGSLISNSIIVALAFTVSPKLALGALLFLVVIHKLEYFLNSKIIGTRIRNPVWLTLLALIIGERLMGIAGMVLAPVVLNYIRLEASQIEVKTPAQK
jgi:predicted PurR-regulated permease PerM